MTRTLLTLFVSGVGLGVGVVSAALQCENHVRARELDRVQRQSDLVRAGNGALRTEIVARLFQLEQEWVAEQAVEGERALAMAREGTPEQ